MGAVQGHFPEAEKDSVIQIASLVSVQGQSSPAVKNIITLNTCSSIVGSEVPARHVPFPLKALAVQQLLTRCHTPVTRKRLRCSPSHPLCRRFATPLHPPTPPICLLVSMWPVPKP